MPQPPYSYVPPPQPDFSCLLHSPILVAAYLCVIFSTIDRLSVALRNICYLSSRTCGVVKCSLRETRSLSFNVARGILKFGLSCCSSISQVSYLYCSFAFNCLSIISPPPSYLDKPQAKPVRLFHLVITISCTIRIFPPSSTALITLFCLCRQRSLPVPLTQRWWASEHRISTPISVKVTSPTLHKKKGRAAASTKGYS